MHPNIYGHCFRWLLLDFGSLFHQRNRDKIKEQDSDGEEIPYSIIWILFPYCISFPDCTVTWVILNPQNLGFVQGFFLFTIWPHGIYMPTISHNSSSDMFSQIFNDKMLHFGLDFTLLKIWMAPWMWTSCKNLEDRSVSPKYRQIALLGLGGWLFGWRKHLAWTKRII